MVGVLVDVVNHFGMNMKEKDDVLELIHDIMHKYRSQQQRALRERDHDLTQMDARVLGFFERHPGATQSDLVQHSGRDKAQLARLIKNLRDRGLLNAEPDPDDRRNVRLSLTDTGQALRAELKQATRHLGVKAVAGLSGAQQQQLRELLKTVRGNLEGF